MQMIDLPRHPLYNCWNRLEDGRINTERNSHDEQKPSRV